MPINIEKIEKELIKGTIDDQYEALNHIKSFISQNMEAVQKQTEDRASELQSKIEKINGNNY